MNREDLEKMFEEKVTSTRMYDEYQNDITNEVKQFIFNEIISEVLKELLKVNWERSNDFTRSKVSWNFIIRDIKKQAKKLYNITL